MQQSHRVSTPTRLRTRPLAAAAATLLLVLASAGPSAAALGDCSQPATSGAGPVATDCLVILQTAVSANNCSGFDPCVCAPKGSLPVSATDSLICLNLATGAGGTLDCPCAISSSSSSTSTTLTTSTTLGAGGSSPTRAEATLLTRITDPVCGASADCGVGVYDMGVGMCRTATNLDTGCNGIAYDADTTDGVKTLASPSCPGPFL